MLLATYVVVDAVDRLASAVADRIVVVLQVLGGQPVRVGAVGREDRPGQLAVGVVGVDPLAVPIGVGEHVAQGVVGVVVERVDGLAGSGAVGW